MDTKGTNVRFTGKFHGEIIPTVPRGSYLIYDLAPKKPKGKFDDFFSGLLHFLTFLIAKLMAGIIP